MSGRTRRFKTAALFSLLVLGPLSLAAAPPIPGMKKPKGKTCFVNQEAARGRAAAWKSARARRAPPAPPSDLTPHVIVLRVSFSDLGMTKTLTETATFFDKLRDYYVENSYGVFQPTFTISNHALGPSTIGNRGEYKLSGTKATYGADCPGDVSCNDQKMLDDAAAIANSLGVDFSAFDQIMVYHAGNGQESTGLASDIWSVYVQTAQTLDGKSFPGFTVVPESEAGSIDPLGVICHEYGHQLGLPDIYDVDTGKSTLGAWDVMDYPYTGSPRGSNPPHLGAWSKAFLGFNSPQQQEGAFSLAPAATSKTAVVKVPISVGGSQEYFLAEYRLRSSGALYDQDVPMDGLAVWHIDDGIALDSTILAQNTVNSPSLSGMGHRGIDLAEADLSPANPDNGDLGAGDLFTDGQTFGSPQSDAYNGQRSGITLTNLSGVGGASLTAGVTFIQSASSLSIVKAVNYPNPGGDPQKYPVRAGAPAGTVTTLVLQLSRPLSADQLELDIYDLNGDRVRSVNGASLSLKLGVGEPSRDFKWVYEYDWDGKNDDGREAVSGVYLYRFKADEELKTGKLMLLR